MTPTVKVVDSTFSHNPAIGYAGENRGKRPDSFIWDIGQGETRTKVFTDIRLKEALDDPAERKVALLLECPAVNAGMYEWIVENTASFDAVLTHQKSLVDQGHPFYFYPFGGSWIREWGLFQKHLMVSLLVSDKKLTEGHRLRHDAAKLPKVDSYGSGVGRYVQSKAEALRPYRFSVVIENDDKDWWFTEKLVDCLSQGTIPLYWGCPGIGNFFDMGGFICWREIDELEAILKSLTPDDYWQRKEAVASNLKLATRYRCPEDWIARSYPELLWKLS